MGIYGRTAQVVLIALLFIAAAGCTGTARSDPSGSPNVIFILHGIDGAGPWYNPLVTGLKAGSAGDQVEMIAWGAPLGLFANLSFGPFHKAAEHKLAQRIRDWRIVHPAGRITLVGHSAGCGVIVNSLSSLDPATEVDQVLLLAPAVSAGYDLSRALAHLRGSGTMHVFYSERDQLLPSTRLTGTYDGVWSDSAGLRGFTSANSLPRQLQDRLLQHPYTSAWAKLGCAGGHFGWRSRPFVEQVLAPLITTDPAQAHNPGNPPKPTVIPAQGRS